jgi:UDP-N-acetylglucosamine:LPS N-acetylglucosamine transferase
MKKIIIPLFASILIAYSSQGQQATPTPRDPSASDSTEAEGYQFSVYMSGLSYQAQVVRASVKAYKKDRLNIQLGLSNVVVTIGEQNDVSSLGQQPANVHVERWLPLPLLLPRCTAAVCHAGSGTTLAALGAGLPLLLLPQGADQFQNAAACARAGVARVITPDAFSAESVAAELANLVCDARYRLAAQRVRGEFPSCRAR